jgi:WD40 repeat protein
MKKITFCLMFIACSGVFQAFSQDSASGFKTILREHTDDVECVAFSPDGKYIATGGWDRAIRVFTIDSTIEWLGTLYGHDAAVTSISFSRDSKKIISGGNDFNTIIWELAPEGIFVQKQSHRFSTTAVTSVAYGMSLKTIFAASADGKITSYDLEKKIERKIDNKEPVNCIGISPDQRNIFCADNGHILKQYDIKGAVTRTFEGHKDAINAVATSINNKYIVTGSSDKTAIIWDNQTGKKLRELIGHEWKVMSVAISMDSKYVLTGSTDGTVKLWDLETGKIVKSFSGVGNQVTYVAIHPNNKLIGSANHLESTIEEGFGAVIWETGIMPPKKAAPPTRPGPATPPGQKPVVKGQVPPAAKPVVDPEKKVIKKNDEVEISIKDNKK